jgi:hypothetical protein
MSRRMNYNAVSPAGMKALGAAHGYIRQSGLPSRLVDLVFLRVSQINGCAYCIDAHSRDFRPRERCPFLLVEDVASFGPCGDEDEVLDRQSGLEDDARMHVEAIGAPGDLGHAQEPESDQPRGEPRLANISVHGAERLHPGRRGRSVVHPLRHATCPAVRCFH